MMYKLNHVKNLFFLSLFMCCHCQNTTTSNKQTSTVCGINGNTETICSPQPGEVWKNGTWYQITWNAMYPTYVASSSLDIYVYFVQNYQNELIKKFTTNSNKGTYPVLVDDTWRLDSSAQTYETLIYILSSGMNPEKQLSNRFSDFPPPVHSFVEQPSLLPNQTTSLPTSTLIESSTPTPESNITSLVTPSLDEWIVKDKIESPHLIQPWIIAVVVLSCLAVLGACVALFWMMHQNKKRNSSVFGEKGHLELNSISSQSVYPTLDKKQSNLSISPPDKPPPSPLRQDATHSFLNTIPCQQQHTGFRSTPTLHPPTHDKVYLLNESIRPQSATSFISSRSEPPLTSTDALLIADTFRQRMRRPEWQEEETKRRELSEQLLKNELEAEGTLMKKVGKRAHLSNNTYQEE